MAIIKKSVIIAVFAIVFIIGPASAAEINMALDKLSPQPVEPGQDFVLSMTLVNEGSDATGITLNIIPDSPIILKNEDDRIISVGSIIKDGAATETYRLHINPHAVSGLYDIEFRARWLSDDQQRETNKTFKVMVRGVPQLAISNITINPELISPKDTFNITFSVSNEGSGIAREVQVITATGELPFVPVDADTKIIKELNPGESSQLSYRAMVKDNAEISSYSIPIKMEYKDENGINISSQSFVGVRVLGKAELAIKIEPQDPVQGDTMTMKMRIENSGHGDAKSVKVNLNIPFEGTKTAFLGKIKPNDDAPAVFTFYVTENGDIPYSATIEYEDDLGLHNITEGLHFFVRDPGNNDMVAPIIVGTLIIGAIVFYQSRRKR